MNLSGIERAAESHSWMARARAEWVKCAERVALYDDYDFTIRDGAVTIDVMQPLDFWFNLQSVVSQALAKAPPAAPVTLRINSPGGYVDQAVAARTLLIEHPGPVTAHVIGVAASAAQLLTIGMDRILVAEGAMMMIHRPVAALYVEGNLEFLSGYSRARLLMLEKHQEVMVQSLARQMRLETDEVMTLLEKETWYTAQEAVDANLAHEISPLLVSQEEEEDEEEDDDGEEERDGPPFPDAKMGVDTGAVSVDALVRLLQ